ELFFDEVLKHDLSVANFVASDFSILNGRLAQHYGIPGVDGWEFQKVKLPAESHRGGVLTMAAVLKVTANGTTTSPVVRGNWVLDRLLGAPAPPPPNDVPAIDPVHVILLNPLRTPYAKGLELYQSFTTINRFP